jgi:endonuclease/exonuclease/phosphatase family metal-dependent hydrolase
VSESRWPALRVGTLNLRCTWDRWDERAPLLIDQMVELRPDVIGLQEVRVPAHQARWIVEQVNARLELGEPRYDFYQRNKTGVLGIREGIAIMSRLPFVERDWLDLWGGSRVAQRARLRAGDGATFDFYNTHLHHERDAGPMRADQASRIVEWMGRHEGAVGQVLVGDFNDLPDSPPIALVKERMRSAHAIAHGRSRRARRRRR